MQISSLGHAGLLIEGKSRSVLVDPWLSEDGAFQASWFQYPSNIHLKNFGLNSVDAVIVTHEHEDHFDRRFLNLLKKTIPVYIPNYPSSYLGARLRNIGFQNIVTVPQWRTVSVGDISFYFVNEHSPMNHDSALVFMDEHCTAVNLNDARLSTQQLNGIKQSSGDIEIAFYQSTGASWHPMCYDYSEERKAEISSLKIAGKQRAALSTLETLQPTIAFPFAGPPCFLDEELIEFNRDPYFEDQWNVADAMNRTGSVRNLIMLPGDELNGVDLELTRDDQWIGFDPADRFEYITDASKRLHPIIERVKKSYGEPTESLWPSFRDYFTRLLKLSSYFNRNIGMKVSFDIEGKHGGEWTVDFENEHVLNEPTDSGYRYAFDSRWLPSLLSGEMRWENFFLSLRFSASRNPDIYCDHLLGLLKMAESRALSAVERFETDSEVGERIELDADGRRYSLQSKCPHA